MRVPLIVPRQIARNRRQRQANQALCTIQMQIEHSIGFQKVYASVNSNFRQEILFIVCSLHVRLFIKQKKIDHP